MNTLFSQCSHYLLLTFTICFVIGLSFAFYFPARPPFLPTLAVSCSIFLVSLIFIHSGNILFLLLIGGFIAVGYLHGVRQASRLPPERDISHFISDNREAVMIGTLSEMVTGNEEKQNAVIEAALIRFEDSDNFLDVTGKVLISLKGRWPQSILPGDTLVLRGFFRNPAPPKTKGLFNYGEYLANRDVFLTGSLLSPLLVHTVEFSIDFDAQKDFFHFIERLRTNLSLKLSALLPQDHAALFQALLLGDKSHISPDIINTYKKCGLMHILAISGMHMALLGFFLFNLIYYFTRFSTFLMLRTNVRKVSLILCIGPLLFYTLLAGSNTPVVRSFIMSMVFILAFCVNKPRSHLTILSSAALIILILNPLVLKSASFQLSFAAVASIILITPKLLALAPLFPGNSSERTVLSTIIRRFIELVAVTVSATLGTIPLLIYHFNQISTITIPANIIVEPLICFWVLPCGFLAIPLLFLFPPLAKIILLSAGIPLSITSNYMSILGSFELSILWLPDPNSFVIVIYYISLIMFLVSRRKYVRHISISVIAATLIIFVAPLTGVTDDFRRSSSVSFIDVGQGSSNLLMLAGGRNIVIDGGATSSPGFDCGEKIIAPYLWSQGIGRIDDVILTHADADHYNGISALFERFKPSRFWIPTEQLEKPGYRLLISEAKRRGIEILSPDTGVFITAHSAALSNLGYQNNHDRIKTSNNDNGIIISLQTDIFSILFPGDISTSREQELVKDDHQLNHDILLSPHHGSITSNSLNFLKAVSPDYLIVSAGDNEHFPSTATLHSAESLAIYVMTTARQGTITVRGDKATFRIEPTIPRN